MPLPQMENSKINWIKDLESDLFEKIKKFCSIKIFNEGDILCQSNFIPSEIFFIIEGQARLIYKFENEEKDKNFHRLETKYGSFNRTFHLPDSVNEDSIVANYNNGILKITVEKKKEKKVD